ncbi:siderophore-interacting protein [Microbacterium sp. NPDC079995]|uniref:siderophore-interacting protein n=1 Tax=unclassified Microbacterium TaxID=2609290 RepID=UPI00344E44C0
MARASALVKPPHQELLHLRVLRTERLAPHWMRVTLGGGDIDRFTARGFDQWFRLFLPVGGEAGLERIPAKANTLFGYLRYLRIPEGERPVMRNYTVRAYRPATTDAGAEIDVDFVLHGHGDTAGPASGWAARAEAGESVVILDEGLGFNPDRGVEDVVLVADETGVPAVAGVLASLPPTATGVAILEAPTADDVLPLEGPAGVEIRWLVREGGAEPGTIALAELMRLPATSGAHHFIVGEQTLPTAGRRHLVSQGVDKAAISFVGYWRSAGATEKVAR